MKVKIFIHCWLIFTIFFFSCERQTEKRKIKLSNEESSTYVNDQLTTTIHLDEKERRAIAVLFFENLTGDVNMQWLQKGLTEMLIRALSQYQSLSVLSTDRLFEILDRLEKTSSNADIDMDVAAIVAKEAKLEAVLSGNIKRKGNNLQITVQLHDPNQGKILQERSVEGPGLEKIFNMVDQLTHTLQKDLYLNLDKKESEKGIAELSTSSLDAWRYYTSGVEFQNKLLHADALSQLEKAVEFDSTFISAYIRLTNAYFSLGNINSAMNLIDELQSLKEKATPYERFQIEYLKAINENDIEKMLEATERWLNEFPDSREANYNMATIYFGVHRFEDAIPYYKKVLDIDPSYKLALNQLGYSYANIGHFDNAISTLQKYSEIAPDEPNPYDSLGEIYFFLGDYAKAEKYYRKAYDNNNNFIISLQHLADIYFDKGDYSKALQIYEKYADKVPIGNLKSKSYSSIAQTFWRMKEYEKAVKYYESALTSSIFPYPIVNSIHDIYVEQNDSVTARKTLLQNYEQIKTLMPENLKQPYLMSLAFMSICYDLNYEESLEMLKTSLQDSDIRAHEMQFRFMLALLYFIKNKSVPENYDFLTDRTNKEFNELIAVLSKLQNLSYAYIWKYFTFVNEIFYQLNDEGMSYYQNLIKLSQKNNSQILEMVFRLLLADLYFHSGDSVNGQKQFQTVGTPTEQQWLIIGPFDNVNGFQRKFPPEKEITLDKKYKSNQKIVRWQISDDGFYDGYIDLKKNLNNANWAIGYGLIYIQSPQKENVQLRLGSDASVKVWLNDEEIWKFNQARSAILDDDIIDVTLKRGRNKVLIKVCNHTGDWGFYFRVTDSKGYGVPHIKFVSPRLIHSEEKLQHITD